MLCYYFRIRTQCDTGIASTANTIKLYTPLHCNWHGTVITVTDWRVSLSKLFKKLSCFSSASGQNNLIVLLFDRLTSGQYSVWCTQTVALILTTSLFVISLLDYYTNALIVCWQANSHVLLNRRLYWTVLKAYLKYTIHDQVRFICCTLNYTCS